MKKLYILYLPLFLIVLSFVVLLNPAFIYGDNTKINKITEGSNDFTVGNPIDEINPAVPVKNNTFLPILITSVIVLGILIFAMYQTFKSRKQS